MAPPEVKRLEDTDENHKEFVDEWCRGPRRLDSAGPHESSCVLRPPKKRSLNDQGVVLTAPCRPHSALRQRVFTRAELGTSADRAPWNEGAQRHGAQIEFHIGTQISTLAPALYGQTHENLFSLGTGLPVSAPAHPTI